MLAKHPTPLSRLLTGRPRQSFGYNLSTCHSRSIASSCCFQSRRRASSSNQTSISTTRTIATSTGHVDPVLERKDDEKNEVPTHVHVEETPLSDMIPTIVRAIFNHALTQGTRSWDVTIRDCFLLNLYQAMFPHRSSPKRTPTALQRLRFRDVKIKVTTYRGKFHLTAVITTTWKRCHEDSGK